jgi:hypothetical protein
MYDIKTLKNLHYYHTQRVNLYQCVKSKESLTFLNRYLRGA